MGFTLNFTVILKQKLHHFINCNTDNDVQHVNNQDEQPKHCCHYKVFLSPEGRRKVTTEGKQFPASVIERSIECDCQLFGNRTFDFFRVTKFYCKFDYYVRLPSPIERLVFDWVRLDTPGLC